MKKLTPILIVALVAFVLFKFKDKIPFISNLFKKKDISEPVGKPVPQGQNVSTN